MADQAGDVTLQTVHEDLRSLTALVASGLRAFPPEWPGEVTRLLRETNRLNEERYAQLDAAIREQAREMHAAIREQARETHAAIREEARETHAVLRALGESQRQIVEEQHQLVLNQQGLAGDIRALSGDIRALIARIDALIKGRGDGGRSR